MANRLSQIATRTGDAGTTGLGNNQRVSKNSLRILDSFGLQDGQEVRWLPNARAGTAVFHFDHA